MSHCKPYGFEILSAGEDDNGKLWDRRSGKLIHSMLEHWDDVHSVELISKLNGHKNRVRSVVFSPDAQYILSSSGGFIGKDAKPVYRPKNGKLPTGKLFCPLETKNIYGQTKEIWLIRLTLAWATEMKGSSIRKDSPRVSHYDWRFIV